MFKYLLIAFGFLFGLAPHINAAASSTSSKRRLGAVQRPFYITVTNRSDKKLYFPHSSIFEAHDPDTMRKKWTHAVKLRPQESSDFLVYPPQQENSPVYKIRFTPQSGNDVVILYKNKIRDMTTLYNIVRQNGNWLFIPKVELEHLIK